MNEGDIWQYKNMEYVHYGPCLGFWNMHQSQQEIQVKLPEDLCDSEMKVYILYLMEKIYRQENKYYETIDQQYIVE